MRELLTQYLYITEKTKSSTVVGNLLTLAGRHEKVGLVNAGNRLRLQAAFGVYIPRDIPIYQQTDNAREERETQYSLKGENIEGKILTHLSLNNNAHYTCKYIFIPCKYIDPLSVYGLEVPDDILTIMEKLPFLQDKEHLSQLYVANETSDCDERKSLCRMVGIGEPAIQIVCEEKYIAPDPILLYKFQYYIGEENSYYMEIGRW